MRKSLISNYSIIFGWEEEQGLGEGGRLIEFEWEEERGGMKWALIRGWVLINFICL